MSATLFLIGSGLSLSAIRAVGVKPIFMGICLWFFYFSRIFGYNNLLYYGMGCVFSAFVAFFALVNPAQNSLWCLLQDHYSQLELKWIVTKATIAALIVLILFLFLGDVILSYIFNLELYAFQITCGVVLFYNGFLGLQKGSFSKIDPTTKISDIMVVPIAVPMIVGPATITAVVTMPAV